MRRIGGSILFAAVLVVAGMPAAYAQMGMGARPPQIRGVWNPVVGSGAVYQIEGKGENKTEMGFAVVGSETLDGKTGYWLEMAFSDPRGNGQMYMKHLIVLDGKQTQIKRMIMQAPGQPPMEMPLSMMAPRGGQTEQLSDYRDRAERVGSETITTPAGTFPCEHWRMKDGSADVWYTDKVAPYGLVKSAGRDGTMTLIRVVSGAKTHIIGNPQKFDPMDMMRRQKDNQ